MKDYKMILRETYDYHSLHFTATGETAKKVIEYGKNIPDEMINERSGGRETEPHITVKFGLVENISQELINLLTGFGPVKVTLGPVSNFITQDSEVLKVDILGEDIKRLNKLVTENIRCIDKFPLYIPHMTIAYMKPHTTEAYLGDRTFERRSMMFDSVTFAAKDGTTKINIYLS